MLIFNSLILQRRRLTTFTQRVWTQGSKELPVLLVSNQTLGQREDRTFCSLN